jgi:anaerobic magnesium-protoporphyrin IX monomethyl ester cyclase
LRFKTDWDKTDWGTTAYVRQCVAANRPMQIHPLNPSRPARHSALNPPATAPTALFQALSLHAPLDSAHSASAVATLSDDALRLVAWYVGGFFPSLGTEEAEAIGLCVLAEAQARSTDTLFWCLAPFRDHLPLMSTELTSGWLHAWDVLKSRPDAALEDPTRDDKKVSLLLRSRETPTAAVPQPPLGTFSTTIERVLLVVPPFLSGNSFLQPPVGMLLAAQRLRDAGCAVSVVDLRTEQGVMPPADVVAKEFDALFVTTSPYDQVQNYFVDYRLSLTIGFVRALVEALAGYRLRPLLGLCGSHGTVRADLVLRDTLADVVLRGEYDVGIPQFVNLFNTRAPVVAPWVVWPETDLSPQLYSLPTGHLIAADDETDVLPAYDLADMTAYFGDGYEGGFPARRTHWAAVLGSRGCPFGCTFCFNFWGRKLRLRSVESICDELELLERAYGVTAAFFLDFTFTANRGWVEDFCREYHARQLRIKWLCETRADLADGPQFALMRRAGCEGVWFGVESFDSAIVQNCAKYRDSEVSVRAVATARKAGLAPHVFVMIGLPGETAESLSHTVQTLASLRVPYTKSVIVATPRFGTPYFRLAEEQYPECALTDSFFALNAVRGLVANDMTPSLIQNAIGVLRDRTTVFTGSAADVRGRLHRGSDLIGYVDK